jgi:arylsulfatase A
MRLIAIAGVLWFTAVVLADQRPNIIVVFADDLGYCDIGCFGAKEIRTPQLDRMASEGRRFTDFYVGAPSCTPSRAALLTGCYPVRVGFGDDIAVRADGSVSPSRVLWPNAEHGLNPDEVTVAELLRDAGYATGMIGKWHLGDAPEFNPVHHGFSEYFGVPYSNDMEPYYYLRGTERLPETVDRDDQIRRFTDEAIEFIERHRDEPFFLYLAHAMPHTPLAASETFRGKSKRGRYGDAVEELDWSTGQILERLRGLDLSERTLVIFTSDNGPWHPRGEQGGSAFPLRGAKGSTYEGGVRVPCVMWWPDSIPPNSECREIATAMDFLPTFAALAGASLPADRKIDGHDIRPLLTDDDAKTPWQALYYYFGNELHAVRSGPWKLRAQNNLLNEDVYAYRRIEGADKVRMPAALYNLDRDLGEQKSVMQDHPKIAKRLLGYLEQARAELGDSLTGVVPTNVRPVGQASTSAPSSAD